MDNFIVQLIARLDASKTPDDLRKIEQELNKKKINLQTVLDTATTQKELKNLAKQMRDVLKSEGIDIDTSTILSSLKKAQKAAEDANKAQQEGTKENIRLRKQELENIRQKNKELAAETDSIKKATANAKARHQEEMGAIDAEREALAKKRKLEDERARKSTSQTKMDNIKFSLDNGHGVSAYQNRINSLIADLKKYGATTNEAEAETAQLQQILDKMKGMSGEQLVAEADKLEQEFKAVKVSVDQAKLSFDKLSQPVSTEKASSLIQRINTFLTKNTKITEEAKVRLQEYVRLLEGGGVTLEKWNEYNNELKKTENSMRGLGKLGANLRQQLKQAAESFAQWISVSSAIMLLVSKTKQAITELKEVDTLLTEISKANDNLTKSQLVGIGDRSFETASRYGRKATDYLAGVQEMSRAGYQDAEAMGELSVKAQGAGAMTADVANSFIVATDKAYKLNGSLTELTEVMDGINYITNHNAVNMTELSEGFSIVASTAASFGVDANELSAALGTMAASTQQSGSEVARAFRAILLNIRQVSDEEEGIDAEGLTKYENACSALNVKLKETKNGVQELRDPMEVLKELSIEYNKLSDTDIRKVNLLNSVGGKLRATQLDALLRGWSDYETMLGQFADGLGSMDKEAAKTAGSLEGKLNTLSNTWTDTVENIANTDAIKAGVDALTGMLNIVDGLTQGFSVLSSLGGKMNSAWGTIGAISGLIMNKNGIGGYTDILVVICIAPTLLKLCNYAT